VDGGRLTGSDQIWLRVGKAINGYKMAKHFQVQITGDAFQIQRRTEAIQAEAALDGIYVLRTPARHPGAKTNTANQCAPSAPCWSTSAP
jgi:hypothetical protein